MANIEGLLDSIRATLSTYGRFGGEESANQDWARSSTGPFCRLRLSAQLIRPT
jgi:hypothetical protein